MRERSNSKRVTTIYSVERIRGTERIKTVPVTVTSMAHALVCRDDWEGTVNELQAHCP